MGVRCDTVQRVHDRVSVSVYWQTWWRLLRLGLEGGSFDIYTLSQCGVLFDF